LATCINADQLTEEDRNGAAESNSSRGCRHHSHQEEGASPQMMLHVGRISPSNTRPRKRKKSCRKNHQRLCTRENRMSLLVLEISVSSSVRQPHAEKKKMTEQRENLPMNSVKVTQKIGEKSHISSCFSCTIVLYTIRYSSMEGGWPSNAASR